ncbi:MAG: aldo/keto reductase [Kiritimatiellia bacterium]
MKVPTRRFGRTGLAMPVYSCGGMRFQHAWDDKPAADIPPDSDRQVEACVRRALDLGIRHIETARGYGTSELQLGRVLPGLPRGEMIVQTKVAPAPTAAKFREDFETSMRHLRLDHVDLLALHGINNAELLDQSIAPGGCLDEALRLRDEGRVRFIGFSSHGPVPVLIGAIDTGAFDYINLHWYYVNRINTPVLPAARAHDMGVFIISPSDKGGKLYEPSARLVELCRPLTPIAFNNLWCLNHEEVHTLSIGAARPSDFDAHVEALAHWDERGKWLPLIESRLRGRIAEVFGDDWVDGWFAGLPEHDRVPGGVNVREILRLWTYAQAFDMLAFARMRYNLLGQAGHWFPGLNAAGVDDEGVRRACRASPYADRIPGLLREAHALLFTEPLQRLGKSP